MTGPTALASLYNVRPFDREIYGEAWVGPSTLPHGAWATTAKYSADTDGRAVEVQELRMPATFYRVVVAPEEDKPAFSLSTGSGREMGQLAVQIAKAIADGMLDLDVEGAK